MPYGSRSATPRRTTVICPSGTTCSTRRSSAQAWSAWLALWAAESATPVTLAWLADRLLTTAATVRGVIEHPAAGRALIVDGDLDDVDAPLTATVLARKPAEVRGVRVPAPPPRPASAVRRSTPARRTTAAVPGVRAVRPSAARPMTKPHDEQPG